MFLLERSSFPFPSSFVLRVSTVSLSSLSRLVPRPVSVQFHRVHDRLVDPVVLSQRRQYASTNSRSRRFAVAAPRRVHGHEGLNAGFFFARSAKSASTADGSRKRSSFFCACVDSSERWLDDDENDDDDDLTVARKTTTTKREEQRGLLRAVRLLRFLLDRRRVVIILSSRRQRRTQKRAQSEKLRDTFSFQKPNLRRSKQRAKP